MNTDKNLLEAEITESILGACFEVLNELGCGFLESIYHKALLIALDDRHLIAQSTVPLVVKFQNVEIGHFFADIVVENRVIVEVKAAKALVSENEAQLLNYLKASGIKVGILVNFGKPRLEWKRLVL